MPIKLPKGFQRRKSSGNALEELPNPPEPSFRVFERPGVRSFDGGNALKRMSQGRPLSAGHIEDDQLYASGGVNNINSNRYALAVRLFGGILLIRYSGSGGTNNSASSGGHDNSSSSARFSSSSTLPSSTDLPLDDRAPPNSKDPYNMPALPVPEPAGRSLRAAGRAFSFGRKKAESSSTPAPRPIIPHAMPDHYAGYNRERAQTESSYASESTTTPPKLLDGGLELSNSDMDGFGSMFENFGKRRSQITLNQSQLGFGNTESPVSSEYQNSCNSNINRDRNRCLPLVRECSQSRTLENLRPIDSHRTNWTDLTIMTHLLAPVQAMIPTTI